MQTQPLFTTYVLYSNQHQKIYIGYTEHLINRFNSHNRLATKGWTIHFRPWVVILTEVYYSKSEAMKRESQLKQANFRAIIWQRIEQMFLSHGYIIL